MSATDTPPNSGSKRWLTLLKFAAAFGLLGYLFYSAWQSDQFDVLQTGKIAWERFALGCLLTMAAIMLTFHRWYLLVRDLGLPLQRSEAYRLGFVGYLLNFATVGTIGGDALRALFIAAKSPGRRGLAVASVVFDRIVGLVALFIVAAVALHAMDLEAIAGDDKVRLGALTGCRGVSTVGAVVGLVALIGLTCFRQAPASRIAQGLMRIPLIGPRLSPFLSAMFAYAGRPKSLFISLGLSIPVHLINALAVVAVASALPIARPSLLAHLGTVPLAHLAGVLPLPGGIGAFEGVLGWLYEAAAETKEAGSHGLLVAFGVRITTLFVAAIGIVVYLTQGKRPAANSDSSTTTPSASDVS